MPFNVSDALKPTFADPIGVDQLKRRNALADREMAAHEGRNALATQQFGLEQDKYQNALVQQDRAQQEAEQRKVAEWALAGAETLAGITDPVEFGRAADAYARHQYFPKLNITRDQITPDSVKQSLSELRVQMGERPFANTPDGQKLAGQQSNELGQIKAREAADARNLSRGHRYGVERDDNQAMQTRETQARKEMMEGSGLGGVKSSDSNTIYRQTAQFFGGMFNPLTGEFSGMDKDQASQVQRIAASASRIFGEQGLSHAEAVQAAVSESQRPIQTPYELQIPHSQFRQETQPFSLNSSAQPKTEFVSPSRQRMNAAFGPSAPQQMPSAPQGPYASPQPSTPYAQAPQASPTQPPQPVQASGSPPANLLKRGTVTTFKNGQRWMLNAQGQPQRVK